MARRPPYIMILITFGFFFLTLVTIIIVERLATRHQRQARCALSFIPTVLDWIFMLPVVGLQR